MTVEVETDTIIKVTIKAEDVEGKGRDVTYVWSLEEARAIKDALIRAVGARPDPPRGPLAPVINITPPKNSGFLNTDAIAQRRLEQKIPQHLLDRAQRAREKVQCQCGDSGWGQNGCCGVSGCNNVPG